MKYTTGNAVVDRLINIDFCDFSIVPTMWEKTIRKAGHPDWYAIKALAHIVRYYRPTEIKNIYGEIIGYERKFKADLLQCNADQLAEISGVSPRLYAEALRRLKAIGVIKPIMRSVKLPMASSYVSVMFIDLDLDVLFSLTYSDGEPKYENMEVVAQTRTNLHTCAERNTQNIESDLHKNVSHTNITTDTLTDIDLSNPSTKSVEDDIELMDRVDYETAKSLYPKIAKAALKVVSEIKGGESVNADMFMTVCENTVNYQRPISNLSAFLTSCFINALNDPIEPLFHWQNSKNAKPESLVNTDFYSSYNFKKSSNRKENSFNRGIEQSPSYSDWNDDDMECLLCANF